MERFPVLPWRSKQDFPRERGLHRINDKASCGGPARSRGSGSSLFSPPASQGSCPSKPETDRDGPHGRAELPHSCPPPNGPWMRKHSAQWEKAKRHFSESPERRMTGTCSRKKADRKQKGLFLGRRKDGEKSKGTSLLSASWCKILLQFLWSFLKTVLGIFKSWKQWCLL